MMTSPPPPPPPLHPPSTGDLRLPPPSRLPVREALATYNADLARSLGSKLFFLDHVPSSEISQWTDLGCGDGATLKAVARAFPLADYVGVDCEAEQRFAGIINFPEATYVSRIGEAPPRPAGGGKTLLIMSSVLHELWSHPLFRWDRHWPEIAACGYDFICIRDFGLPEMAYSTPTPPEWLEGILARKDLADLLAEFVKKWGPVTNLASCVHFFLKYPYRNNWLRELEENYVGSSWEKTWWNVATGGYRTRHLQFTTTRAYRERLRREFGIEDTLVHTHMELVLEREGA